MGTRDVTRSLFLGLGKRSIATRRANCKPNIALEVWAASTFAWHQNTVYPAVDAWWHELHIRFDALD